MRAPPSDAPQIRAIKSFGNHTATELRCVFSGQYILRCTNLLQPNWTVDRPEGFGEFSQVQCVRVAFFTPRPISLSNTIEYPRVNGGQITFCGRLYRCERMPVQEPNAIVSAEKKKAPHPVWQPIATHRATYQSARMRQTSWPDEAGRTTG